MIQSSYKSRNFCSGMSTTYRLEYTAECHVAACLARSDGVMVPVKPLTCCGGVFTTLAGALHPTPVIVDVSQAHRLISR